MSKMINALSRLIKRKEILLFLILVIAILGLYGWITGKMIFAAWSTKYIPIAPSNILMISTLSLIILLNSRFGSSFFSKKISPFLITMVSLFGLFIFLQFLFKLTSDIENVFIKNPASLNHIVTGRMSPITALLIILSGTGSLGLFLTARRGFRYLAGSLSAFAFLLTSVLLIGYLYQAPLLYGGHIIPVSLPSAVCFWLFSLTLLRLTESEFWSFNIIKGKRITLLLLQWFLPIVIIIIILEGYLDNVFSFNHINPPLTGALILFIVIVITSFIIYRVSSIIGHRIMMAEKAVIESEERISSIMENSADAIFITDRQGKYIYSNKTAQSMLGYSAEEIRNMHFADISPKEKIEEYISTFNSILQNGKVFAEIELLKKDGTFISTDLNSVLLPSGHIYGSCRDITERKKTEQALKESDNKYRTIADYNYDWEFWRTNENSFIYNSPSCERITGYSPLDFSNNPDLFTQVIHPDDLKLYDTHLEINGLNSPCAGIDYRIISRSGDIRWIHHICQPVFNDEKNIIGRRGSNSDITDRKNAENQVRELNIKLSSLNADKDRFIAILGHDLKSPFNNLLGLSEVLKDNVHNLKTEEIEDLAQMINNTARSTHSLLEEILLWARTQTGKIPFKPQMLNLEEICTDLIDLLNPSAARKKISLSYFSENKVTLTADPYMLKTVLRNLVSNAVKFTDINGTITVKATENKDEITISVEDTGVGIKTENLSKLFDITQVLTTKGTAEETGSGLGLLLCKEFVEKHGGKIWVKSEENKGSSFTFTIPGNLKSD